MNATLPHKAAAARSARKFTSGRIAAGGAAVVAAGLLALGTPAILAPALAQLKPSETVETPFGRAPLSFADLVEKVKPSVVSISVTNGKVASTWRSWRPHARHPRPAG